MFDNMIFDVAPTWDEPLEVWASKVGGRGRFIVEHFRPDAEGNLQYLQTLDFHNGIVNVGLNMLLNVSFGDTTQLANWYVFPISNVGYTALLSADTMASHSGWSESVAYSEATRPQWTVGTATGGSITNATQMVMTINADSTALVGLGVASSSTKNETSSTLWATGLFGSVQNMNSGDVLKITYIVTLTATN